MTSYGKNNPAALRMIREAMVNTDLSEGEIKNWIDNEKKRGKKFPVEKLRKRTSSGYNLHWSKLMKNKNFTLAETTKSWADLNPKEKNLYCVEAQQTVTQSFGEVSLNAQKKHIKELRHKMNELIGRDLQRRSLYMEVDEGLNSPTKIMILNGNLLIFVQKNCISQRPSLKTR